MAEPRESSELYAGHGSTPVPDPTERTTQALLREIAALKELMAARLDAMEKAMDIKFDGIQRQFSDALQAAKEAVGKQQDASDKAISKSELAFTKQIDQMGELIQLSRQASDERINGIKEQLSMIAGTGGGLKQGWTYLTGAVILVVGLLGILAYIK